MNLKLEFILYAIISIATASNWSIDSSTEMLKSFCGLQKGVNWKNFRNISNNVLPPNSNYNKRVRSILAKFSQHLAHAVDAYDRGSDGITTMCSSSVTSIPPSLAHGPTVFDDILRNQYSHFNGARMDLVTASGLLHEATEDLKCLYPDSVCIAVDQITIKKYVNGKVEIQVDGFESRREIKPVLTQAAELSYVLGRSKYEISDASGLLSQDELQQYREFSVRLHEAKNKIDNTVSVINQNTASVAQPNNLDRAKFGSFVKECESFVSEKNLRL